jgi:hypothetical protein
MKGSLRERKASPPGLVAGTLTLLARQWLLPQRGDDGPSTGDAMPSSWSSERLRPTSSRRLVTRLPAYSLRSVRVARKRPEQMAKGWALMSSRRSATLSGWASWLGYADLFSVSFSSVSCCAPSRFFRPAASSRRSSHLPRSGNRLCPCESWWALATPSTRRVRRHWPVHRPSRIPRRLRPAPQLRRRRVTRQPPLVRSIQAACPCMPAGGR